MKNSGFAFLLIAVLLLFSCSSKTQKENTLNISGAFALYPLVVKWAEEYKQTNEEARINISAGGAGKGMADAIAGTVDLGMFSRAILQVELDRGIWYIGLCKDAVLPTISSNNPYLDKLQKRGITQKEFREIFIENSITSWDEILDINENSEIEVYTRSDACGAAGTWALYLDGNQEDIKGIGIHGDPGLAEAVSKDPMGIGFNNTIYIYDVKTSKKRPGMEIIPIDQNENGQIDPEERFYDDFSSVLNAIANGDYPSPPARELYFVAKGKPKKQATIDFIKWTLTDGQEFIKEAGYVPISDEKISEYLKMLE
jgi:phosphate transport system substrate-binding protein